MCRPRARVRGLRGMLKHPGLVSFPFAFTLKGVQGDFLFFISLFFQLVSGAVDNSGTGGIGEGFELLGVAGAADGVGLVAFGESGDVRHVGFLDLDMLDADETERTVLADPAVSDLADFRHGAFLLGYPQRSAADTPCQKFEGCRGQKKSRRIVPAASV